MRRAVRLHVVDLLAVEGAREERTAAALKSARA